jgi:hypothetical protein
VQVPAQRSMLRVLVQQVGLAQPIDEALIDGAPVRAQPERVPQVAEPRSAQRRVAQPALARSPDSAEFRCCSLRIRSPGP